MYGGWRVACNVQARVVLRIIRLELPAGRRSLRSYVMCLIKVGRHFRNFLPTMHSCLLSIPVILTFLQCMICKVASHLVNLCGMLGGFVPEPTEPLPLK